MSHIIKAVALALACALTLPWPPAAGTTNQPSPTTPAAATPSLPTPRPTLRRGAPTGARTSSPRPGARPGVEHLFSTPSSSPILSMPFPTRCPTTARLDEDGDRGREYKKILQSVYDKGYILSTTWGT